MVVMTKNPKILDISKKIETRLYPIVENNTCEIKNIYDLNYFTKAFDDPKSTLSRKILEPLFKECYEELN